jgi:hypothetical protein
MGIINEIEKDNSRLVMHCPLNANRGKGYEKITRKYCKQVN